MPAKTRPLNRKNLHGLWSALLIPWTDRAELDCARSATEVRSCAGTGVPGVYPGGTTGGFCAQDDQTYERATRITGEQAHDATALGRGRNSKPATWSFIV